MLCIKSSKNVPVKYFGGGGGGGGGGIFVSETGSHCRALAGLEFTM